MFWFKRKGAWGGVERKAVAKVMLCCFCSHTVRIRENLK